ncbi:Uncharacterised protein [BD1-7 clade bacterium]|uniref:Uncharacterized protein n=1 Tax=BD1-7 clade bacterium TaxID=2029982 RepID=A0A5S9PGN0_9GAMM|nr:Uncharacterised protein [BD1-7 clade bacterium]CAA0103161.1 Uncharacterised protein [BD1-7 clade bacterium]
MMRIKKAAVYCLGLLAIVGSYSALSDTSTRGCSAYVIPYMPYSATSSQIIYVSRVPASWVGEGKDETGDITVDAIDDSGNLYDLGVVAQAAPNTVTKIASQISTALQNEGFTGGKVSLRIQVENPENIFAYVSYNAGSVRGYVDVECVK